MAVFGLAKKVGGKVQWYLRADFILRSSEELVLDSVASLVRGLLPTRGRLVLTTQRLLYMPLYPRFVPRIWKTEEIDLLDIEHVSEGRWLRGIWGGFPGAPLFQIQLRDRTVYQFQTLGAGRWRREIEELVQHQA